MKLLLDTSSEVCYLTIVNGLTKHHFELTANRILARDLLKFIRESLASSGDSFSGITGIGVMKGPGSFTGLRIGLTVANTLADSLGVAIVSATGENWEQDALDSLGAGKNEKIVLPFYGSEARITKQKK